MELLDVLTVAYASEARTIELYRGDLTDLTPQEAVDILVVSTFSNNYLPISGTLIGSLYRKGVSVEELAKDKAVDFRYSCFSWLSHELDAPPPGIHVGRIVCFEPPIFGSITEVIGDMFRGLIPILSLSEPASVAISLNSPGNRGDLPSDVLEAIVDAATHWMALGLPLKQLKLVEQSPAKATALKPVFAQLKAQYAAQPLTESSVPQYDVYISYAPKDSSEKVQLIVQELHQHRPDLRISTDRPALDPSTAWQQAIHDMIASSRKVFVIYSPMYLRTKVCQEEFNIALLHQRNASEPRIFPILLSNAQLHTYMQQVPYIDCGSGDDEQLRAACSAFLETLVS